MFIIVFLYYFLESITSNRYYVFLVLIWLGCSYMLKFHEVYRFTKVPQLRKISRLSTTNIRQNSNRRSNRDSLGIGKWLGTNLKSIGKLQIGRWIKGWFGGGDNSGSEIPTNSVSMDASMGLSQGVTLVLMSGGAAGGNAIVPPDYFDKETGEYLGKGGTDEIRFISKGDWEAGNLSNFETYTTSDVSEENVFYHYLNLYNLAPKGADEICISCTYDKDGYFTGYSFENNRNILLPKLRKDTDINNRWDAINLIVHEISAHGNDWIKYGEYSRSIFWEREKRATNRQIRHFSWPNTSENFKRMIYEQYGRHHFVVPKNEQYKFFGQYGID
jgi:hypothetical protein